MTARITLRTIAAALLRAALKITPPGAAEWGRAMLAELHHVEGDWAALAWAIGGAGILAKHALLSVFVPGNANQIAPSEGKFFAKETPMRKSTAIAAAACLAASLLFFVAPTFRQAFQLSLTQWHSLIRSLYGGYSYRDPSAAFSKIADQARENHDAEAMAFVALHRRSAPDSAALADEAVRIEPQLTWIYAVVASSNRSQPEINDWIAKLEQFDPQNAVPHLIQAEVAESNALNRNRFVFQSYLTDPAWLSAMSDAFASSKIDTYGDRVRDLDHRVALLHGFDDPYQAQSEYFLTAGVFPGMGNSNDYVKLLLKSGDALDARGDHQGAEKQYRLATHVGEVLQAASRPAAGLFRTPAFADVLLQDPYHHLASFYEKQGDLEQAAHFSDLAVKADQERQSALDSIRPLIAGTAAERWNADILGLSGIAMFACIVIIPLCAIITIVKSRSIQLSKLRAGRVTKLLASCAIVGLFVSTAALYLSYRPYAQIVRAYLHDGDTSRLLALSAFLSHLDYAQLPPQHQALYSLWNFPMYFWAGIIALCAIALVFTAVKFIAQSRRPIVAA
jgi:hypothetical protein